MIYSIISLARLLVSWVAGSRPRRPTRGSTGCRARSSHCLLDPYRGAAVAAVALGLLAGALPALAAKPASPTAEAESIAETAARRYKSGDYELAAQLYDRAYELAKRPALLFNAARSWDRAGRLKEALQRYEACIAVETDAGPREEARLRACRLRDCPGRGRRHRGRLRQRSRSGNRTRDHRRRDRG